MGGSRHTPPWWPCMRATSTRSPSPPRSSRNGTSSPAPKRSSVTRIGGVALPLEWPDNGRLSYDWVLVLGDTLDMASRRLEAHQLPSVLPPHVVELLLVAAWKLLKREENCLRVDPDPSTTAVVLVGDVHGQLHDVLHLLEITGFPSASQVYVFCGDYVDRGAWGLETYILLLAWKVLLPNQVFLLRGNHETRLCSIAYGFEKEVMVKYGDRATLLYQKILSCFRAHPLAAVIAGSVYVTHGGLFRQCNVLTSTLSNNNTNFKNFIGNQSRTLTLGTLEDLAKASRDVLDPSGVGSNAIPGDIIWSDPSPNPGLEVNMTRGIGLLFGPDCTQEFMAKHRLKLIIRSHEGPDAREKRGDMESMDNGYTIDHVVHAGKLITLFSAPDYPQFQTGSHRYENKGAYMVLEPPDFSEPHYFTFEAILPRPQVSSYYDYVNALDSDEDLDFVRGSEHSKELVQS